MAPEPRSRRRWNYHRFRDRYERKRAERRADPPRFFVRPLRVVAGVALILTGTLIGWLPGPGFILLALPGAYLLASELRWVAEALDRGEAETMPRLRRLWRRMRGSDRRSEAGCINGDCAEVGSTGCRTATRDDDVRCPSEA